MRAMRWDPSLAELTALWYRSGVTVAFGGLADRIDAMMIGLGARRSLRRICTNLVTPLTNWLRWRCTIRFCTGG